MWQKASLGTRMGEVYLTVSGQILSIQMLPVPLVLGESVVLAESVVREHMAAQPNS
jgi:hypothetical protein